MELEIGISVVVATYSRLDEAKKAITSLLRQSVQPSEIIMIDNESSESLQIDVRIQELKRARPSAKENMTRELVHFCTQLFLGAQRAGA